MTGDSKRKTDALLAAMVEYEAALKAVDDAQAVVAKTEANIAACLAGKRVAAIKAPANPRRKRAKNGDGAQLRATALLISDVSRPWSIKQVARELRVPVGQAGRGLSKAARLGEIRRIGRALYQGGAAQSKAS